MIKIVKSGKWAQKNPALPILKITEGMQVDKIPVSELQLLINSGWAIDTTSISITATTNTEKPSTSWKRIDLMKYCKDNKIDFSISDKKTTILEKINGQLL